MDEDFFFFKFYITIDLRRDKDRARHEERTSGTPQRQQLRLINSTYNLFKRLEQKRLT